MQFALSWNRSLRANQPRQPCWSPPATTPTGSVPKGPGRICVGPLRSPPNSGKVTTRYRLNRGGDRQANAALYRIVLTRMSSHEETASTWPVVETKD